MENQRVIRIGGTLEIPESELEYQYSHASGPGGEGVNTSDSAVQLRFNVLTSKSIPEDVRIRLLGAAGNRISEDGVLLISSQQYRQQLRNKFDVREKFVTLLMKVALPPVTRKRTGVPAMERETRLDLKKRVSITKRHRRKVSVNEDEQ